MRISDWRSDVCASDLDQRVRGDAAMRGQTVQPPGVAGFDEEVQSRARGHSGIPSSGSSAASRAERCSRRSGSTGNGGPSSSSIDARSGSSSSGAARSEEHTSELQSLMRISYAVFCLKKKNKTTTNKTYTR